MRTLHTSPLLARLPPSPTLHHSTLFHPLFSPLHAVISPDVFLNGGEIGVPPYFAARLSFPERVTPWNVDKLREAVMAGPGRNPGAVAVEDEKGRIVLLSRDKQVSRGWQGGGRQARRQAGRQAGMWQVAPLHMPCLHQASKRFPVQLPFQLHWHLRCGPGMQKRETVAKQLLGGTAGGAVTPGKTRTGGSSQYGGGRVRACVCCVLAVQPAMRAGHTRLDPARGALHPPYSNAGMCAVPLPPAP